MQARRTRTSQPIAQAARFQRPVQKENSEPLRSLTTRQNGVQLNRVIGRNEKQAQIAVIRPIEKETILRPDIKGSDRELLCADFHDQSYQYLLRRENFFQISPDFLAGCEVTPKMRSILVDWLVQVSSRFQLVQETLHLTVYILDRMLATKTIGKDELQLVGITAMLVAAKFEEIFSPDMGDYEFITDNTYNRKQIIRMELRVLDTIGFQLTRPCSLQFLRWFSRELQAEGIINDEDYNYVHVMAKYLGEVALLDASMTHIKPSRIAIAGIVIGLKLRAVDIEISERLLFKAMQMVKVSIEEVKAVVGMLAFVALKPTYRSRLVAIKQKFASSRLHSVSSWSEEMMKVAEETTRI
ncbi:unnamed protein product [Caenorhabditis auriculariae]|uniref:Cyclin N-terminal domain-containing protein n=1 Tax=Caenorhabditis auriculariae TaxID=2777116 RepID=A0A8S1H3W6_9PELO|nr:unnamed protein product [Caenorhabditis auriculariae]